MLVYLVLPNLPWPTRHVLVVIDADFVNGHDFLSNCDVVTTRLGIKHRSRWRFKYIYIYIYIIHLQMVDVRLAFLFAGWYDNWIAIFKKLYQKWYCGKWLANHPHITTLHSIILYLYLSLLTFIYLYLSVYPSIHPSICVWLCVCAMVKTHYMGNSHRNPYNGVICIYTVYIYIYI